jgi:Uma2 family endonuclease
MSAPLKGSGAKTIADWLAQPAESRMELVDGELVQKAAPDVPHALSQGGVIATIRGAFHRRGGGGHPGGWWILPEVDIELRGDGFRPDVTGWRRDRVSVLPKERPVTIRPDWICEIVSTSNASTDTVLKLRKYHQAGVPHYWLLDPTSQTLTVYRHHADGYIAVLAAARGEKVKAEPFDAIELSIDLLFGDDPEE